MANASSNIAVLIEPLVKALAQFANVLQLKVVGLVNDCFHDHTERVFIDGLQTSFQCAIGTCWGRKQDAHLSENAQYANTLLKHTGEVPSTAVASFRKNCIQRSFFATPIKIAVAKPGSMILQQNFHVTQTQKKTALLLVEKTIKEITGPS